jgi:hypothetical protein
MGEAMGGPDNKRQDSDRRGGPTPIISRYFLRGRRRGGRRADERHRIYVDRPGAWVITACTLVVALSIADAYVTLHLLAQGGKEINPFMRAVLAQGDRQFLIVKLGLTFAGAAILGLHKTWSLGRTCLWIALGGYAMLTGYHLVIQAVRAWAG